jgi:hypothetical protein
MKTLRHYCYCAILLLLLHGCAVQQQPPTTPYKTTPLYILNPKPERILLLNTYNVDSASYRSNKSELFKKFIDSILIITATEIKDREGIDAKVLPGYSNLSLFGDSSIYLLMAKHHATHAIVIDSFNVYFNLRDVEVTKSQNGAKSKEAYYDINSDIHFLFYTGHSLFKELMMTKKWQHSARPVLSGMLAAGPNVVVQKKDAWKISAANLYDYLNLFFMAK